MDKPQEIEEIISWEGAHVKCDLCGFEWAAVYPIGVEKLECKNCTNMVYFEVL